MKLAPLYAVPVKEWPNHWPPGIREVWRSKDYLVQVYDDTLCAARITVSTTKMRTGNYVGNISWETLNGIKAAVGFADCDAVELYPREEDVINDANMRHLFVVGTSPLVWREGRGMTR